MGRRSPEAELDSPRARRSSRDTAERYGRNRRWARGPHFSLQYRRGMGAAVRTRNPAVPATAMACDKIGGTIAEEFLQRIGSIWMFICCATVWLKRAP